MAGISVSKPSVFYVKCPKHGAVRSDEPVCPICMMWAKPTPMGACWGHEWAAVAWMALCVEAAGEKPENVTAWMLSRDPYFHHVGEM